MDFSSSGGFVWWFLLLWFGAPSVLAGCFAGYFSRPGKTSRSVFLSVGALLTMIAASMSIILFPIGVFLLGLCIGRSARRGGTSV